LRTYGIERRSVIRRLGESRARVGNDPSAGEDRFLTNPASSPPGPRH